MAKVRKIDAPVLILGLGGTGFDTLMRVKAEFHRRFEGERFPDGSEASQPPRTQYCEIDTESDIGRKSMYGLRLEAGEFKDIGGDYDAIKAAMANKPYVREWLDQSLQSNDITNNGAGCYRQVSRLLLFAKYNEVRMALSGKLRTLAAVTPNMADRSRRISVKIMAGISGGTGSGLLLDIAYILRDIARLNGYVINIEAYLMMPDVTIDHAAGGMEAKRKLYSINSYAFLKEMDYWMDAERTGVTLTQNYSDTEQVTWAGAPFDDVYLLCSQNDHGVTIADSYRHNIDAVAEYLVHCYEGSNDNGDESFEIVRSKEEGDGKAAEGDNGAANAQNSFGFQSAHSNQHAIINMMHHPFPVPTRYHSLGAYSNAGEDRLMELQEWTMIYEEAVTRFEAHPAVMDGKVPADLKRDILSLDKPVAGTKAAAVRNGFNARHPIPPLEGYDYDSLRDQVAESAPHGSLYTSYANTLSECRGDEELHVTDDLWAMFLTVADAIGKDINRGPEYLYALLSEGQNSLTVALPKYVETITDLKSRASKGMEDEMENSRASFNRFLHPAGLEWTRRRALYDDYIAKVTGLYNAAQANAYYGALLKALEEFENKLAMYTAILGDMVAGIKAQRNVYQDALRNAQNTTISTLFDTGAMRADLTRIFADQTRRDTIVQQIYNNVIIVTQKLMEMAWTPEQLPGMVNEAIDALRENMFIGVGGLSLTQKIITYQKVGGGPALQEYVSNTLCEKLMNGAEVMFYPSAESLGLPNSIAAHTCMISVPNNSTDITAGIRAFCETQHLLAIIKQSMSSDRIFWVNDKCGMPLYFYGYLSNLREEYNRSRSAHKAYHLFMNDNPEVRNRVGRMDEMKQKWDRVMPDPFISRAAREFGERNEQLKEAEEQGLLRLEYDFTYDQEPRVKVVKSVFRRINGVTVSRRTIAEALARIPFDQGAVDELLKLEPVEANEAALKEGLKTLGAYREAVQALDGNRAETELTFEHLDHAAKAWGVVLGIENDLQKPDPAMDVDREAAVQNAWKAAYGRAIREALGRRPDLVAELTDHVSCRGLISAELARVDGLIGDVQAIIGAIQHKDTDQVLRDCADVARMIMYKLIEVKLVKVSSTVLEGPSADLYRRGDDHADLKRIYDCFESYPVLLQFVAWYSSIGRNEPGAMAITMNEAAEKRRRIDDKDGIDEEIEAVKAVATEWRGKLDGVKQNVMMAYADHALTRDAYTLCIAMIEAINREFGDFIRTYTTT